MKFPITRTLLGSAIIAFIAIHGLRPSPSELPVNRLESPSAAPVADGPDARLDQSPGLTRTTELSVADRQSIFRQIAEADRAFVNPADSPESHLAFNHTLNLSFTVSSDAVEVRPRRSVSENGD
jgi:hypothetical protein